ncbi:hypothetical protein BDR22DRAFT_849742 [Usnea florida]
MLSSNEFRTVRSRAGLWVGMIDLPSDVVSSFCGFFLVCWWEGEGAFLDASYLIFILLGLGWED